MSNTTILRPESCCWSCIADELSFSLNPWASLLILETQPLSCNIVLVTGMQPNGGSEVTPILLAPPAYKSCFSSMGIRMLMETIRFNPFSTTNFHSV